MGLIADRRKRILINRYEVITDKELRRVVEEYGGRVCPKVRLADVFHISRSGISDPLYRYALQSHFDFLITDEATRLPLFAVEFDGSNHWRDPDLIRRDKMKQAVCEQFDFPLLRIDSEFLRQYRSFTLLSWLTELWFLHEAWYEAQRRGEVPLDEPFIYFGFMKLREGGGIEYPFDLAQPTHLLIIRSYDEGYVAGVCPEYISREPEVGDTRSTAYAVLPLPKNRYIIGRASCRLFHFPPIGPATLVMDLSTVDLGERLKRYLKGEYVPDSAEQLATLHKHTEGWSREGSILST